ncbi:hypothetical protein WOLCODRAFT_144199 [Wolfiporia cocos MD-104 SS10]|uniref:Uncharacterized protein n=1 Tax=Wolfiporia cocos (strain MD-104) TaxID=742152 RepID=A0A2H3JLK3_WOLCO|nr:hypothetical protein WOLCODRAFT_144199 [Wolfiporia cocos MD-104 SS10]
MPNLCFNAYSALRAWQVLTSEAEMQQQDISGPCTNAGQLIDVDTLALYECVTSPDQDSVEDMAKDLDALMLSIGAQYPSTWTVLQPIPLLCRVSPYLDLASVGSMFQYGRRNCGQFLLDYSDPMTKYIADFPYSDILVMFKFMHSLGCYIRIERVKDKTLGEVVEEISTAFEKYWKIIGGVSLDQSGSIVENEDECDVHICRIPDGADDSAVTKEEEHIIHQLNSQLIFPEGLMHIVHNIFRVSMVVGPNPLMIGSDPNITPPWYMTTTRTNALEPVVLLPTEKFDFFSMSLFDINKTEFPPVEPFFFQYIAECHNHKAGVHTYPTFSDLDQWSDEYAKLENASWMPFSAGWPSTEIRIWYYWPDSNENEAYQNVVTIPNISPNTRLKDLARATGTACKHFIYDQCNIASNNLPVIIRMTPYPRFYRKRDGTILEIKNDSSIYLAGLSHVSGTNVFRALLMV